MAKKIDYEAKFERIHEIGSKNHPHTWFTANRMAVEVLWECGIDPSDPMHKYLVSRVVRKVLDVVSEGR